MTSVGAITGNATTKAAEDAGDRELAGASPRSLAGQGEPGAGRAPARATQPAARGVPAEADQSAPDYADAHLEDLAASIREKGLMQPLFWRALPSTEAFEIVAGERRWRAAQKAACMRCR